MKPRPQFDHDIHAFLKQRWSPRSFASQPLTAEQILTLFEAARWSASCMNTQPWRFIWSVKDGSEKYQLLFSLLTPRNQEWVSLAPLLILALTQTTYPKGDPNRWAEHDLGLAIGNLTTQASSMGLYIHNMAGFSVERAKEQFTLPVGLEPLTMIAVGYLGEVSLLSEFNQKREEELQTRLPLMDLFLE